MSNNIDYDITREIDPVETLDEVQAKLERRRREQQAEPKASDREAEAGTMRFPADRGAHNKPEAKQRAAETTRAKRIKRERRVNREQELRESRWVTAGHKVREKRVQLLDRVFYRLKADGAYSGTKQEFFDEGLALLEDKYTCDNNRSERTGPPRCD